MFIYYVFDDMNACMFDLFDVVIGMHRDADNKRFLFYAFSTNGIRSPTALIN